MADATLHTFDFVNVMIYSSLSQTMKDATYYANTKKVPKNLVVLGAGFFGNGGNGDEYAYAAILKADPAAWSKDQATVGRMTVHYEETHGDDEADRGLLEGGFPAGSWSGRLHRGYVRRSLPLQGDPGRDVTLGVQWGA